MMYACVQGSTNGIPISYMVLPVVPLVIPLVPMVMPIVPLDLQIIPFVFCTTGKSMAPLATNCIIDKVTTGTIAKTPNGAYID